MLQKMLQYRTRPATRKTVLALAATALLSACATPYSETPLATNFETTKQQKLQAASHWQHIADDTAATLLASLKTGQVCNAPMQQCQHLFVRQNKDESAFTRAFRTQFLTSLVNRGSHVAKGPQGAVEIDVEVQVVKFSPNRIEGHYVSHSAIYTGLWALHGVWVKDAHPGLAGGLLLGATDVARWMNAEFASGPAPQHEIIVTVSATNADRYLGRATNTYYVADTDSALYTPVVKPAPLPTQALKVKGGE